MTSTWSAGYVLDIPYTSGFYKEMAPPYLDFVLTSTGSRPAGLKDGATYCELACGQGLGTALMAAANPGVRFWGFDFNPAQIANARRLAAEAGLKNVTFEDWSFDEANGPKGEGLPLFDCIALHGIYSWISPENRGAIVHFLETRLRPGGVVYVSYNTMPGWAHIAPLQRLMREHANRHPDRSDLQAAAAIDFAKALREGNGLYFAQNPGIAGRMDKLPGMNRNYLAHEYLNGHWHPLYHLDVVRELDPARLTFAASATITENMDALALPPALRETIAGVRDRAWAEQLRDYATNKGFRRDLFVRGATPLTGVEVSRTLSDLRFALTVPREAVSFKFAGPVGELTGQEETYRPIADALAQRPQTVAELSRLPELVGKPGGNLLQALALLVHGGHVHPAPYDAKGRGADAARAFNRAVANRIRIGETLSFLAAPVIGTGVAATYAELIGWLAVSENPKTSPAAAATFGWGIMAQTGQRLVKEGQTLQSEAETLPELEAQLTAFMTGKLPIWRTLGVI